MRVTIRPETTEDRVSIWDVNQAAFGGVESLGFYVGHGSNQSMPDSKRTIIRQ